eukprot:2083761-Pleurochrysis_carterae.AAC.2
MKQHVRGSKYDELTNRPFGFTGSTSSDQPSRVVRCFDVPALGVIQKWLPASGEDPELFHVLHDDGDEEDLEMVEATEV